VRKQSIITDPAVFSEDFIPSYIHEREFQIKWLMAALFPAIRGRKPVNVWIHGKPGSGKTCVSKFVLQKLTERWGKIGTAYVNCWQHNTLYSALDHILSEFRLLGGEAPSTSVKLRRFFNFVKDRPFILILDEIDAPPPKERNDLLYNLSRTGNIGIVCISRRDETYFQLDERVRSRLSARLLEFEAYSPEQVMTILRERANQALKYKTYDDEVLSIIAELAQGDIRVGLETLKTAAEYAEFEDDKISLKHIHKGAKDLRRSQRENVLARLTSHHKIIYNIIEQKPSILSGELWSNYMDVCNNTNERPIGRRTFSAYLERLENLRLVSTTKPSISGKVRSFKVDQ
jgi:cell division control protein 6